MAGKLYQIYPFLARTKKLRRLLDNCIGYKILRREIFPRKLAFPKEDSII